MDSKIDEELTYLFRHLDGYIYDVVCKVIFDSTKDPEYSAVTATNLIMCYANVVEYFDGEKPYNDLEEYFNISKFTKREYRRFKKSARKESKYYIGKIFDDALKQFEK